MKENSKEDLIKKWSVILGPMGITGSQLDNLSHLAENQSNHILDYKYGHKKTRRAGKKHKKKSND